MDEAKTNRAGLPGRGFPRLLRLLEYVAQASEPISLAEVCAELAIPKSSGWVMVQHLLEQDYLAAGPTSQTYVAGPSMYRLALSTVDRLTLRQVAQQHLEDLRDELTLDVFLGIPTGGQLIYISRFEGSQPLTWPVVLGRTQPLHASAGGKIMLAFAPGRWDSYKASNADLTKLTGQTITSASDLEVEIENVRKNGYATSDGDQLEGLFTLAMPIRDHDVMQGVLTTCGYAPQVRARVAPIVEAMTRTVGEIEAALTGR